MFPRSQAGALIRYLQAGLAARDLSPEEALALIGALHAHLSSPDAPGTGLHGAYARVMRTLELEMPDVYKYVVSAWEESQRRAPSTDGSDDFYSTDGSLGKEARLSMPAQSPLLFPEVGTYSQANAVSGSAEPAEPGETDDETLEPEVERPQARSARPADAAADGPVQSETEAAAEDGVDENVEEVGMARVVEDVDAEQMEPEDSEDPEASHDDEVSATEVDDRPAETEPVAIEPAAQERDVHSETPPEPHVGGGEAESEWPASEQRAAAEHLEEFDVQEDEPPPPD